MSDERFISFRDTASIEHTYRIVDIQSVGVSQEANGTSYIRAFDFPLTVPRDEAIRVKAKWLQEG